MFKKGMVLNNVPFLTFITFLMLVYVAYGYHVDNTVHLISKESKRGDQLYSELQSVQEMYDRESLQSKIAEETAEWGLYESIDPPLVIRTKEKDS
jgi:hypothetical protein